MAKRYVLPPFLIDVVASVAYVRWLRRKAQTHMKRDRQRGNVSATGEAYRLAIHNAVIASGGNDHYTGEKLNWSLISTYDNDLARAGSRKYKQSFALLPTADHVGDGTAAAEFRICGWRTNDAKSDLELNEFIRLCERILMHSTSSHSSKFMELDMPEFQNGDGTTTRIGYINRHNQKCCGHRGVAGNAEGQRGYRMECMQTDSGKICGFVYGANGCDIFQRRCPKCQGGAEGIPF